MLWRNGDGRNNWLGDSGRYWDSWVTSRCAWSSSLTERAALHKANRTSSSRIPCWESVYVTHEESRLILGKVEVSPLEPERWGLGFYILFNAPSIGRTDRDCWARRSMLEPSCAGGLTAKAASFSKAERLIPTERLEGILAMALDGINSRDLPVHFLGIEAQNKSSRKEPVRETTLIWGREMGSVSSPESMNP